MPDKIDSFGTCYSLRKINEKNPIVFIHGVGLTKEIWESQINFFKDYNTLTYDLLGHGKTPLKKNRINFKDFTKQLLKLIKELNFDKIHLVGFSLGALIARDFASEHGDKLSSLILLGSVYKRSEEQNRVVKNRLEVAKMNKPASKHAALRRWFSEDFFNKNPDIYKKIYSILEKNNPLDFLNTDCDIVVELIGEEKGLSYDLVKKTLESKINVVTANKALLSRHGTELFEIADKNNAQFFLINLTSFNTLSKGKTYENKFTENFLENFFVNKINFGDYILKQNNFKSFFPFGIDGHYSKEGYEILSEIILENTKKDELRNCNYDIIKN